MESLSILHLSVSAITPPTVSETGLIAANVFLVEFIISSIVCHLVASCLVLLYRLCIKISERIHGDLHSTSVPRGSSDGGHIGIYTPEIRLP